MKKNIETGQRFGRLVIVKEVEHHKMPNGIYRRMFLCKCDCGNEVTCSLANLTSGNTSSCGCLKKETASNNNSTHRQSKTRLYRCWQHMKHRCYREDDENYSYYGGRGIIMCDEWKDSYENFSKWAIDNGYKENLTIDRIDCDGNYEPNNCRWITQKEQTRNTRRNTFVYLEGKGFSMHKFTLSELCEILKVNYPLSVKRIYQYIKKRKAVEDGIISNMEQSIRERKPILMCDKDGTIINEYNSITDAAQSNGISVSAVGNNLSGRSKTCKGHIFKYKQL